MHTNFSLHKLEPFVHPTGSVLAQTAVGSLAGHVINIVYQWLHPGRVILGMPLFTVINPLSAGICAGIFAIIDSVAKIALENSKFRDLAQKPLYQLFRIAITVTVSALISSVILGVSFPIAVAAIVSSLVAYTIFLHLAKKFSTLNYAE